MYQERLSKLIEALQREGQSASILTDPLSIRYFTGYYVEPGERFYALVIKANSSGEFIINNLFPKPNLKGLLNDQIDVVGFTDGEPVVESLAQHLGQGTIGVDKFMDAHFLLELMAANNKLDFVNGSNVTDGIRAVKSPEEIDLMKQASAINDQAMEMIWELLKEGPTERQAVDRLLEIYQELGADGPSFEPIIAYGANGADPHHLTNDDRPQVGDSIVIDIGCMYKGYASDMTRTVFYGEASQEARDIYETVRLANQAGIDAISKGVSYASLDKAARDVITDAGYGPYFTHRLGHFIGQEAHEHGDVGQHNPQPVQEGHVFSIEPGIYLTGNIGVRIEDLVAITADGPKVLNHVTKELTILSLD
ncbi:M24 family metallopeptidase [Hutsoniella sourekii]